METQQTSITSNILDLMKQKGPVLPVHIARVIESDILIASAHLSELASKKQIRISNIKVGGSPLYYLPGQESKLQDFADNLHEKEKKIYDMLKQKKILRDSDLDPVFKVAVRQIKDFAVPLEVTHKNNKEIFWKWYLLSNTEIEALIRDSLNLKKPEMQRKIEKPELKKEPVKQEERKPEPIKKETPAPLADLFFTKLIDYFNRNKIKVIEKEIVKKGTEIEYIIKIPSAVGDLTYFCKARSKKRISDGDLSNAFVKGQLKKLPVLFLTNGELTKKGKGALERDFKLHFKQI